MEALWNAPRGSSQAAELELWATLIDAYEREHHPLPSPDPVEAIRFRVEQMGLKPDELAKIMGGRSRVSEVFNRRRPLSVSMMRSLNRYLHVPAESLLAGPSAKVR